MTPNVLHRLGPRPLAMILILVLAACAEDQQPTVSPAPLVMVGVDGAEWQVIDEMIEAGELPTMARIKREGAWGHLINPGPQVSPVVWTTFVTGHFSRAHGILAHVHPYTESAGKRPVSSELRRKPALWNIASHYGLRTTVLGYFVSHPPEEVNGVIVSPKAPRRVEGSVYPPGALDFDSERYAELRSDPVQSDLWSRYFGWDFDRAQASDPDSPYRDAAAVVIERNLDRRILDDEFVHRATMELTAQPADLFITYYRLPDFMSHSLWLYYDASDWDQPPDPREQALFGSAVKESYRFVDAALGDILEAWGDRANIVVVSDHGFGSIAARSTEKDRRYQYLTGDHRPNGVLLATGPDIAPGEIRGMTIMEIAPTLITLMGLPLSGELPGNIAVDLLREDFFEDHPLETVPHYGEVEVRRAQAGLDRAAEEQDMNSLRGLGYIGEGVSLADPAADGDYDFWSASDQLIAGNLHTEIVYHLLNEDIAAAEDTLELAKSRRPELVPLLLKISHGKFRGLMDQLPEGYLDPEPFARFFARHEQATSIGDGFTN